MKSTLKGLTGILGLMSTLCLANATDFGEGQQNFSGPRILDNSNGAFNHWTGIGRVVIDGRVCTGTLIDNRDSTPLRTTSAYVLTAGHCIDHSNGKIITNKPIKGTVKFNYFTEPRQNRSFPIKQVKWRSMQGVDMAIVELDTNLHMLIKHGVQPLKLAQHLPNEGSNVLIVGTPQEGTTQVAACTFQHATDVIEGKWAWRNNFKTQCRGVVPGVSGSPLLDRYTNEIIGVVGTVNDEDSVLKPCELNEPCTLTATGYEAITGNVYGNPTPFIKSCFRNGVMVEDAEQCGLYPTFNVSLEDDTPQAKAIETTEAGDVLDATWNIGFSIDTAFYRYKTVRLAKNCELRSHYSAPISATHTRIEADIGSQPGRYFLCILGMSQGQRFSAGLLRNALSIPVVLTKE